MACIPRPWPRPLRSRDLLGLAHGYGVHGLICPSDLSKSPKSVWIFHVCRPCPGPSKTNLRHHSASGGTDPVFFFFFLPTITFFSQHGRMDEFKLWLLFWVCNFFTGSAILWDLFGAFLIYIINLKVRRFLWYLQELLLKDGFVLGTRTTLSNPRRFSVLSFLL